MELFPELGNLKDFNNMVGISLGFLIGMLFFQGIDHLVDFVKGCFSSNCPENVKIETRIDEFELSDSTPLLIKPIENDYASTISPPHTENQMKKHIKSDIELGSEPENSEERSILLLANEAMASPNQRHHLIDQLLGVIEALDLLQAKSNELSRKSLTVCLKSRRCSTAELECLADSIDQETHKLQYSIDHCRRLIHGSEGVFESMLPRIWITEQGIQRLNLRLSNMKELANAIHEMLLAASAFPGSRSSDQSSVSISRSLSSEKLNSDQFQKNLEGELNRLVADANLAAKQQQQLQPLSVPQTQHTSRERTRPHSQVVNKQECPKGPFTHKLTGHQLRKLYSYLDEMEKELDQLHGTVEGYTYQWGKRSKTFNIPIPEIGSKIPMSFLVPVIIDCIVDGLLLGITTSISFHAGFILSFANAIEMAFLGLAVSIRIQKCTGSSLFARQASIVIPPLIMLGTSVLAVCFGNSIKAHAVLYKLFISFGIVALLSLVINELLVEARDLSSKSDNAFWSGMIFFFGIYMVIFMDMIFPENSSV
jgi:zinc transporter ZupT